MACEFAPTSLSDWAPVWGLREVKSSTQPKDEHYDDIAIQLYVLRGSGVQIGSVELIHVNGNYVGDDGPIVWREYFARIDVNAAVEGRLAGLAGIVSEQHAVLQRPRAPRVQPAHHCHVPFSCEFWDRCTARKPDDWIFNLPLLRQRGFEQLRKAGIQSIGQIPRGFRLTERQAVIRRVVRSGREHVSKGLSRALRGFGPPAVYLDFETMNPAVPLYPGTSPYQRIPFQWSLHELDRRDTLTHREFLADAATDPRPAFIASLLEATQASTLPIIVYSSFEKSVLDEMAALFPKHRRAIGKTQEAPS